jgi:hypothetical protein
MRRKSTEFPGITVVAAMSFRRFAPRTRFFFNEIGAAMNRLIPYVAVLALATAALPGCNTTSTTTTTPAG